MNDVVLVAATVDHLQALSRDAGHFATLLGSPVPAGWPEFPEAVDFTLAKLQDRPDEDQWWMHFFLVDGELVGSGGFVGPPDGGTVEIGYEIAPQFRGKGYGIAAARAMVLKASADGAVATVIAHTLPEDSPSTGVLRRVGFRFAGEVLGTEAGTVWRWELPVADRR
jgi:RimJ/RimL family protein N-acetyltransferase